MPLKKEPTVYPFHDPVEGGINKKLKNYRKIKTTDSFLKAFADAKQRNIMEIKHFKTMINKTTQIYGFREKVICLALYQNDPEFYNEFQKIFSLPKVSSLCELLDNIQFSSGFTENRVLDVLSEETAKWTDTRKYCSITFDVMPLSRGVSYSQSEKKIIGFTRDGQSEKTNQFADCSLVFMARGICAPWKQLLGYYFCDSTTLSDELPPILEEVVKAVAGCLIPLALVCNPSAANRRALNRLTKANDEASADRHNKENVRILNVDLALVYDPLHLLRGFRNSMLSYDVSYDGGRARTNWKEVEDQFEMELARPLYRIELKDEHIYRNKIRKMKLDECTKVFDSNIGGLCCYRRMFRAPDAGIPDGNGKIPTGGATHPLRSTGEILSLMKNVFDSVNGIQPIRGKYVRVEVTRRSYHKQQWMKYVKRLHDIKFVDNDNCEKKVLSVKNWLTTLKSFIGLWQYFVSVCVGSFDARYLQTDALENLFAKIRSSKIRKVRPSCIEFQNSMKALLFTDALTIHSSFSNRGDDSCKCVIGLKHLNSLLEVRASYNYEEMCSSLDSAENNEKRSGNFRATSNLEINSISSTYSLNRNPRASMYVARKLLNKVSNCRNCKKIIFSKGHNKYQSKSVLNPSEIFKVQLLKCRQLINDYLDNSPQRNDLYKCLSEYLNSNLDFSFFECKDSQHDTILKCNFIFIMIQLETKYWCKYVSKLLGGVNNVRCIFNLLSDFKKQACVSGTIKECH